MTVHTSATSTRVSFHRYQETPRRLKNNENLGSQSLKLLFWNFFFRRHIIGAFFRVPMFLVVTAAPFSLVC